MKLLYRVLLTSALLLLVAEAAFSAPTPRRITLEHPLFRVGYSSQGVSFAPSGGDLTWSWQLSGLSGLANIPLTGISPVAEDKNVSYNRGILTEHYLFKTNLIEQQFTLSTAEGLHGDLVIEGQIAANGDFSPVEGGWRWSRKDQHLFLGDVTVYDARGNLLEATMTVTATSSRIVVPFQALRHATFPVTIDPQIGPDDFVLHNTAPKSYQPRMVYNTATDAFFAVWTNYQGSGLPRNENIHGAAFTRAQIVASPSLVDQFCDYPSFLVSGTPPANAGLNSSATRADVAFSGDKHLVVWEDYRGSTSSTREVKIQLTTGTAVSGDTTALFKDVVFVSTYGQAHYPAVAGNNTAFLVTCVAGKTSLSPASYSVAGQFIDPAGTPVAGYLPIFNDAAEFTDVDVDARGDGNFALVASTLNTIHYGWASATEMVSTGKLTAAGQIGSVAVAAGKDNSSALLVWSELSGTGADAKYIIMGNIAGKTFQISPANQYSAGQPAVAYNPDTDSWLVVWQASPSLGPTSGTMIWGCEVSAAGTPGQEFPLSKQSRTSVSPTVAYDEDLDEFWIAWSGGGNKDQLLAQRWINHLNDCVISVEKDFTPENNYLSPLNKSTDIFVTALQAKTASGEALYPLVFTLKDSAVFRTSYSATRLTVTKPASSLADYNVARNQLFYVRDDSLNYEKENVLSFSVRAASVPAAPAGPTVYHDDTIRIADVNEMFAATFSAAVTFLEDQPGAMIPFTYHSGDKGRERNTLSLAVTAYPPILNTAPTLQSNPSYPGGGHTDPIPRTAETKTEALLVPLKANATGSGNLTFNLTDLKGGVWASSQNDLTSSFTVRVTVLPVNDPPQGYDRTDMLTEDGSYSFSSGSFGFFDLNDSPSNQLSAVIITTLPARGSMTLDGVAVTAGQSIAAADLGQLMYKPVAQESGFGYTSFTFQVQDDGDTANGGIDTDPTPRTFTLDVWPVNDPPSGIDKTITLAEDASYTFAAADFGFSDPVDGPANQLKAVVLTTLPASGVLQLNGAAVTATQAVPAEELSKLTFTPAMNESGSPYASFTFQVQDNGGTTDGGIDTDPTPNTLTIHVNPLNDAPAGSDQSITLAENQIYPFTVANFGFSDPDDTPPHTFKAVVLTTLPASGLLHFNGAAVTSAQVVPVAVLNQLTYTPAVNGSGIPYASFTFQVQDDGGTAGGGIDTDPTPNTLTINVTPVNKAPAGTDKNLTLQEDQAYTFAAADFGFSDPNDAPAHLFQAVLITTLPATGSLQFDGAAVTATQVVPVIDLGLLTYTPEVNGSGTPYASFTFQVQDDGGTSNGGTDTDPTPNTVTISVTPVNDAPAGTDRTITLLEDNTYTFSTADFGFSDPDDAPANQLNAVVLTTLPAMGVLQLNGAVVTATQVVPVADLGQLTFTPVANGNGTPYASFTFQVQDDGGTASGGTDTDPTPNTLTINVTSVNDAPESMDFTIAFAEDFVYAFDLISPLLFDNNDTPPNQPMGVVITTLPTRGVLKLGGTAVTALQVLSSDEFNNLTYTPAANQYGIPLDSLTFQVQDDGGRANGGIDTDPTPNTITMNVVPWNDAPEGTDQSVNLYATEAYAFKASDFGYSDPNDTPPHLFKAVIITTLPGAGVLQFDGAAVTARQSVPVADLGKLIFTPAADGYGTPYASFTFQVQDDGASISGGTDTDPTPNTLTINLTPINNPPFGADKSITLLEDIKYTFTAADFGFSDPDDSPAHQLKAVLLSTLPAAGVLQLNGATVTATRSIAAADLGQLTFTPAANGNGSPYASFTFQVQDDGGTAHGGIDTDPTPNTITLNVTPVNDPPAGLDKSISLLEDEIYTFAAADFGFSDPYDTPAHQFNTVIITDVPTTGVLQHYGVNITTAKAVPASDLGKLTYTPVANGNGSPYASFTFRVQDDGGIANGGADTDPTGNTITLNVTPVNDSPEGKDNTISLSEDHVHTFTAADFGFSDPNDIPAHLLQAVLLTSLPTVGVMQLNGAAVAASTAVTVADLGLLTFTPVPNGYGTPYASFTFQVQDNGGTAHNGTDTDPTPNSITLNVTPVNDSPLISVSSTQQTVQYSDPILPVTVTTSDVDNAYGQLILSAAWKEASQSAFTPGLPPDVQLTEVPGNSFPKHWTLSGNINVPQGTYILRMTVTDGDPDPLTNSAYADLEITVTPEDARITFTGAFFATTASTSSSTVVVPLSALIRGGAAGTSDQDNSPGDIRNARVTFTIVETGQTFGPLTPELVSPDDPSTGTVHTEWMAELGTSEAKVYTIAMKVGGSYLRESAEDDAVVTVSKPLNDFITGGGFIGLVNSGGTMAGDKGSRNHFGFSLKFNTYKTILRGQINLLIRRTVNDVVRTYQIKGSKMTFLTVTQGTSAGPGTAGFYGTGAIQDITDPLLPVTIEENAIIQMVMTDFGDPGSGGNDPVADRIGITIRTTFGGLWYSSLTDGKKTLEQKLDGGNLRIRNVFRIITGNTPSTTRLVTSAEPSFPGKQVSFTATVTGSLPIKPTGSVLFYDYFNGTQKLLGKTTLNQGVATLTTSSLPAGIHEITAYYVGDFRYACSASLINQTIGFSANDPDEKIFLSNNGSVLSVYPNPFSDKLNFRLLPAIDDYARIDLFDINGRYIKTIFNQKVKAGMLYQAVYIPYTQVKGTYMYRVTLGRWLWTGKVLYQPLR